jgi:RNA polymerase sigma-70 factor (ECF subfamily)
MSETSASLLDRLRLEPDAASWQLLVDLYTPLIQSWLRRHAAPAQDGDDLVQDVLTVVVRRLPEFELQPRRGAFRCWLRTITVNCLRDYWRSKRVHPQGTGDSEFAAVLEDLEDPHSGLSRQWDEEHDRHVIARLLERIEPRFEARTWRAFTRLAFERASPDEVAAELGITINAVFIAKSRVLSEFRREAQGLIEESLD